MDQESMSISWRHKVLRLIKNPKLQFLWLSVFLVIVFLAAVAFWYSPVVFKGNSVELMTEETVLARNYALTGKYGMESKLNIVLAPELVNDYAQPSTVGNKFSAFSYGLVFKIFGWQDWDHLVLIANIISAVSLVIFTLTVYLVFGWAAALVFPFIFILLPFNAQTAQYVGFMEFAQLYFSVFLLAFLFGRNLKYNWLPLAVAGIFLALAGLTREAYLVFMPILFFWLLARKKIKELLWVFIPAGLLLLIFWLPSFIGAGASNDYVKIFVTADPAGESYSDFHYYSHIYPDPYTYHFDRQRVIDQFNADVAQADANWLYKIDRWKTGQNIGVRSAGLLERLAVGTNNLFAHLSKFLAIESIGGPVIFIFLLYGFWRLRRQDRGLYGLLVFWLAGSVLILSYVILAIRDHIMDFAWPITILVALALVDLPALLRDYFQIKKNSKLFAAFIIILVLYGLVLANHVYFGRGYDGNRNLCLEFLSQKIQAQNVSSTAVIAVGERSAHPVLNYLSGKSVIYFDPATIERLVQEHKLQEAFDKFNVKYIAGFNASTSALIIQNSQAINIADWPDPDKITPPVSYTKSWMLNLVR